MFVCLCTNGQLLFVYVYMCICAQPIIDLLELYGHAKRLNGIFLARLASQACRGALNGGDDLDLKPNNTLRVAYMSLSRVRRQCLTSISVSSDPQASPWRSLALTADSQKGLSPFLSHLGGKKIRKFVAFADHTLVRCVTNLQIFARKRDYTVSSTTIHEASHDIYIHNIHNTNSANKYGLKFVCARIIECLFVHVCEQ